MAAGPETKRFYQSFGRACREAREALGLSQREAAAAAGIDPVTYNKIEAGGVSVGLHNGLPLTEAYSLVRAPDGGWSVSPEKLREHRKRELERKKAEIESQLAALH